VPLSNEILIKKISCGANHSLILTQDGDVYWFGKNEFEEQMTPKKLTINLHIANGSTSLPLGHYRSASLPLTTLLLVTLPLRAITARVITAPNILNIQIFENSFIEINLCYV
jgi:hypothetical protein